MTQKTNDNTSKATSGTQGSQMGGKTSPAGGPETFESDQVNQGKGKDRISQGGSQAGRSDPYPPVNPDRPMMAGGQGGKTGSEGGQSGVSHPGTQGGNFGAQGEIAGSNLAESGKAGLEEE